MENGFFENYMFRLQNILSHTEWSSVTSLAHDMKKCWEKHTQVFFCGNGGSASNAMHLANDFLYGVAKKTGKGLRAHALSSNPSILTCLGNDLGYDRIYSEQLAVYGASRDLLIVLSGSGNSPNIINILKQAKSMHIKSYAILGFNGGIVKTLADVAIHFPIDDMQIAEDLQLIVGHMVMQWLYQHIGATNHKMKEMEYA